MVSAFCYCAILFSDTFQHFRLSCRCYLQQPLPLLITFCHHTRALYGEATTVNLSWLIYVVPKSPTKRQPCAPSLTLTVTELKKLITSYVICESINNPLQLPLVLQILLMPLQLMLKILSSRFDSHWRLFLWQLFSPLVTLFSQMNHIRDDFFLPDGYSDGVFCWLWLTPAQHFVPDA